MRLLPALLALATSALIAADVPAGFTSLFNGKDLAGWHGYNPHSVAKLTGEKKDAMLKKMRDEFSQHWSVKDGEIYNPGTGPYATTDQEYGDFELTLEYNMAPKGDSGVYLRGAPQVQIWDPTDEKSFKHGCQLGSGALWNNSPGKPGKDPLVLADKPAGEWNTLRVVMVGARVSVWLNGKQTVDHATMENYYDRKAALAAKGPICLQTHGAPIRWRNVAIREIAGEEANRILTAKAAAGFKSIFNGKDFTGWAGDVANFEIVDGGIRCKTGKGGTPYYDQDLTDFAVRLEFKLPKGGNNGLALRYPGKGNTAYVGMCELQVLDDNYDKVKGKIETSRRSRSSAPRSRSNSTASSSSRPTSPRSTWPRSWRRAPTRARTARTATLALPATMTRRNSATSRSRTWRPSKPTPSAPPKPLE